MTVMKSNLLSYLLPFALAVGCAACSDDNAPNQDETLIPYTPIELSRAETEQLESLYDFSLNLFNAELQIDSNKVSNFVISPLSTAYLLSALANGAEGETQANILRVLGIESGDLSQLNALMQTLDNRLPVIDNTISYKVGSAFWLTDTLAYSRDFSSGMSDFFDIELNHTDFTWDKNSDSKALRDIKEWFANQNGVYSPLEIVLASDRNFALTNALYFKGKWSRKFDKKLTKPSVPFYNADGTVGMVDMMVSNETFSVIDFGESWPMYVVMLPYGNNAFSMQVVVPKNGYNISQCIETLKRDSEAGVTFNPAKIENFAAKVGDYKLEFPKFSVLSYSSPSSVLSEYCDLKLSGADFSGIASGEKLSMDYLSQSVKIDVDESGTQANVQTVGGGDIMASPVDGVLRIDEPFAFFISEQGTGSVILAGCINNLKK